VYSYRRQTNGAAVVYRDILQNAMLPSVAFLAIISLSNTTIHMAHIIRDFFSSTQCADIELAKQEPRHELSMPRPLQKMRDAVDADGARIKY
jgi:hypothetical protein